MGGRHAAMPHRDFKERSVVLAVAHPNPWSSASFYLPSQSLADSRCNLHATSRSPHSRRSPSCRFILCRVALLYLVLLRRRCPPIPCLAASSRHNSVRPRRGVFWPLEFIEPSSRARTTFLTLPLRSLFASKSCRCSDPLSLFEHLPQRSVLALWGSIRV